MDTPRRAPPACAHSHRSGAADPFTAPLALPVSTAAARPVYREGGRSACVLTSTRASWWGVEGGHTRALSPERAFDGRRMHPPAHTPCTPTLHSFPHPLSLHPHPPPHSSVSTLQLRSNPHLVQAVGATVPPSTAHTGCNYHGVANLTLRVSVCRGVVGGGYAGR
jgi:hypothetical protein